MRLARELERRLERLVDGVSGAIFRGRVHPVDLGTRLLREADLNMTYGPAGPVVPNGFTMTLHPEDLLPAGSPDELANELALTVQVTAADRGWRLEGPVQVTVGGDPRMKPNQVKIESRIVPGPLLAWGQLIGTRRHADIAPNRVLLGRATECDISFGEPEISRRHAIIHREQQRTWVTDLVSANGTAVDGVPVTTTMPLRPGAQLTLGPTTFMFRLVEPMSRESRGG